MAILQRQVEIETMEGSFVRYWQEVYAQYAGKNDGGAIDYMHANARPSDIFRILIVDSSRSYNINEVVTKRLDFIEILPTKCTASSGSGTAAPHRT